MKKALFRAVRLGRVDDLKLLMTHNELLSVINAQNNQGKTVLHIAAGMGNVPMVELLIAMGANINTRDFQGRTPLHDAAENAPEERGMVKFLCAQKGISVDVKDYTGKTPLMITSVKKPLTITRLLEAGADVRVIQTPGRTIQETCLPHSAAFKAILVSAPNCLMNNQNRIDTRLITNLKRRIPRDKPSLDTKSQLATPYYSESSYRNMVIQLLEARIQMTLAFVSLIHGEYKSDEVIKRFVAAMNHSPLLVKKELMNILEGKHSLFKNNQQALIQLIQELEPILSNLAKQSFDEVKKILSSPDPPTLGKFRNALLQASKLSGSTVESEIEALARNESNHTQTEVRNSFTHFVKNLIKIASLQGNSDDITFHKLLNQVAILIQENTMDQINQRMMKPSNKEPNNSSDKLKLAMLCLLLQNPPQNSTDLLYNLSELISIKIRRPTGSISLDSLISKYPQTILKIIAEVEELHQTITGVKYNENQPSPLSKLKEQASSEKAIRETQSQNGNSKNETISLLNIPTWAKKHIETVKSNLSALDSKNHAKNEEPQISSTTINEFQNTTSKTSPR